MSEASGRLEEHRRTHYQSDDVMRRVTVEGAKKWWTLAREVRPVTVTPDMMGTITTKEQELTAEQVRAEAHARVELAMGELMMQGPLYPDEVGELRKEFNDFLRETEYERE